MDVHLYKEILHDLSAVGGLSENDKFYSCLSKKYQSINEQTLRSIICLWNQREVTRISHEIKDIDVYGWYKNLRKSGNLSACQHIAKQLNYPASLIAKIVLTTYAGQIKEKKPRTSAKQAESLREQSTSGSKIKNNSFAKTSRHSRNVCTIKKHDDPRVELALNLFDENDDIGKYFLDKFKFIRDRSSRNLVAESTDDSVEKCTQQEEAIDKNDESVKIPPTDDLNNSPESETDSDTDSYDSSEEGEYYNVKELMENTNLIDDPILAVDVFMCNTSDDQYGPTSDFIANSSGQTYEILLEERVKEIGLSYKTEDKLRGVGVDKTPDIILAVPVAVDGFVINWIESKALFADYKLHQEFKKNQFKNYINRFGPGLVLYWHGFVDDLPELYLLNKQLIIRDRFPEIESFTFINSSKFRTWMKSANKNAAKD